MTWACPYCSAVTKPERWSKGFLRCPHCLCTSSTRRLFVDDAAADGADAEREAMAARARERRLRRGGLRRLWERDKGRCHLCGGKVRWDAKGNGAPSRDHVIPRADGGSHQAENLKLAHTGCNQLRGRMPIEEWHARRADLRSA